MSNAAAKILTLDDDPGISTQYRWLLSQYQVTGACDRREAVKIAARELPDLAIVDLGLPPDPDGGSEGLAAVEEILRVSPYTRVIVVTGNENRQFAVRAIALGAHDFFRKPIDEDALTLTVERALWVSGLEQENRRLLASAPRSPIAGIIGDSPQIRKVLRDLERVANTDAAILLLGESGTGKELAAQALCRLSHRATKPFVAINCAAIPETLLESELFGHEKGAFTGAIKQTIGKIEQAQGGTLFLDEIGDIPVSMQIKLLRFLEDRVVERVGGRQRIPVDVRIICATNQNLTKFIEDGRFREDLFYRINEIAIEIPPLRERDGDVQLLANFFLNVYGVQFNKVVRGFSNEAIAAMRLHPWRGNVRELEKRVKRAVIMTQKGMISAEDLDLTAVESAVCLPLKEVRQRAEREAIEQAMVNANGNISKAATLLGISRPTMYTMLAEHGLDTQIRSKSTQSIPEGEVQ